jgi:AcrR family transcriptional regulator
MGTKERREREKADTRQRILDAARDLFVRDGFEATTMRALADVIEYTPTAIYHHFPSKEALLFELCATDFCMLAHVFQKIGRVEDPVERLDKIGEAYVDFGLRYPAHYRFMFMAARPAVDPEESGLHKGDPGEDAYAFLRDTVTEVIVSGRFKPEYSDAEEIAQMLWSAMHGIVSIQIAKQNDPWVEFRDARTLAARTREALLVAMLRTRG